MNLFDTLVESALSVDQLLQSLRPVVEKEILHHDILREMFDSGLLTNLTFIGGTGFKGNDLADLCGILKTGLFSKYGLAEKVSEHIDICAVSSFDRHPAVLINHYPINSGTSGLILYAESLQEIMADKMLALALRPNRVKNRDLWDILWLHSQGIALDRTPIGNHCLGCCACWKAKYEGKGHN